MKTISDLNKKWWYRLIKVLYLLFLSLCILGTLVIIWTSYAPQFDSTKSYIQCDNEGVMIPAQISAADIYLYDGFVSSTEDAYKIRLYCSSDADIAQMYQSYLPSSVTPTDNIQIARQVRDDLPKYAEHIQLNQDNYHMKNVYTQRDWAATIGFSLLSVAIILVVFEAVRRVFYYIILGSIRPKKNNVAQN